MDETEAIRDLDAPPTNPLESIFVLPDYMASNPRILEWYNEMVTQLRREAQGIPMQAAQYTLMERIAYTYAYMRWQELTNQELSDRARQAMQDSWQKMVDQFNRLLEKHNDKIMTEMLLKIQGIIKEHLATIKDPVERQRITRGLIEDFAALDI